jgi:hypothetical protein
MKLLKPPASWLPPGASDWATVEDVAIALGKDVRTVKDWCAKRLVHCQELAGGYGGRWISVAEGCWPINGPGVDDYRAQRSAVSRTNGATGAIKGGKASAAARAAKKSTRNDSPSKRSA